MSLFGISKTFGMVGVRIWLAGDKGSTIIDGDFEGLYHNL